MKKLLAAIICGALMLSFASCGAGEQETTTNETPEIIETTSGLVDSQTTNSSAEATTDVTTSTSLVAPNPENIEFDASNIVLSFGALSDIHVHTTNKDGEEKFKSAISLLTEEAKKDDADGLDAIAIAGDIADTGKKEEVAKFASLVKTYFPNKSVMLATGNHDISGVKMSDYYNAMGEEYFANDVDSDIASGSRHCVVNGYHFIFVEPSSYGNNCPYSEQTIKWLDETLAKITAEEPNAYIFLFTHPMIYRTCYGSELGSFWYTTYLTATLEKYPQVVTFGGHLHFPINDERSIMQDKFTSLGCGSVRYLAIEGGYANANGTVPNDAYSVSSGLLVQVDKYGNCRITRMYFSETTTFKTPWIISAPKADGSHLEKYTLDRANENKAPALSGNVTFTPSPVAGSSAGKITIAAGTDDDFVHHYVIDIFDKASNAKVATYNVLSDFYTKANPTDMSREFSYSVGTLPDGEYKASVTAVDSWDAVSNALSCEFKVGTGEMNAELPDTYADIDFDGGKVTDKKDKLSLTINSVDITEREFKFAGKTASVSSVSVISAGQNVIARFKDYNASTITDFYNSEKGFSVEGLFVNRAPSGSQGVICGTQAGGWGIAQAAGVPYLFTYVGSSNSRIDAKSASSTEELTHVVATFIYDASTQKTSTALYLDGKLVSMDTKSGKIKISASAGAENAFVLGADIDSNGMGGDFKMTDFSIVDAKIYAEALNRKQVETAYNNAVENFG